MNLPQQVEPETLDSSMEDPSNPTAFKKLSFLDRYLSLWIFLAMISGVILGSFFPLKDFLDTIKIDTVSLPIAIGLWLMMWPVLCNVKYELLKVILVQKRMWTQIKVSLFLNWVVGPLLMTGLAWVALPNLQGYRNGLILVGLARCIAMVLIWNHLAQGSAEYGAILVAVNSVLQILFFAPLATLYLGMGADKTTLNVGFWDVFKNVMIFLGVPVFFGILTKFGVTFLKGKDWFENQFLSFIEPITTLALIYTILILFIFQGSEVITYIVYVLRVAVPMFIYYGIMWFCTIMISRWMNSSYEESITQAFTAASNNFELAIAVAIGTFGPNSQEALAATVGPLTEVPALLGLVYVALWLKKRLFWPQVTFVVMTEQENKDTQNIELDEMKV